MIADGPSQGRIKVQPGGRRIRALSDVGVDDLRHYLLEQWKR